jgi:hypothetical protein
MVSLTPPEKLFARMDTGAVTVPTHLPHVEFTMTGQMQMSILDKRIRDLEINVTKVSVILDNMQKVNEKHGNKFDTVMGFLEVMITAMAGIATALIGVYFKGRKKV